MNAIPSGAEAGPAGLSVVGLALVGLKRRKRS